MKKNTIAKGANKKQPKKNNITIYNCLMIRKTAFVPAFIKKQIHPQRRGNPIKIFNHTDCFVQ